MSMGHLYHGYVSHNQRVNFLPAYTWQNDTGEIEMEEKVRGSGWTNRSSRFGAFLVAIEAMAQSK